MPIKRFKSLTRIYLSPRVLSIGFFAFPYGMTFFLTVLMPQAWLTDVGITNTDIGLFGLVSLPYVLKFLWAPLVDIVRIPVLHRLGQRRSWLILIHTILIGGFTLLAYSNPNPHNLWYVGSIALALSCVAATQDIIVDAYRIEILDKDQAVPGVSMLIFGYRVGSLVAKAGPLYLAHYFSWTTAYLVMASLISVGIAATLLNPEPRLTHRRRTLWDTAVDPFRELVSRSPLWILVCAFIVLYRLGDAMINGMAIPFYIKQIGFTKPEIASVMNVFGIGATIVGGFIGAIVMRRLTVFQALLVCGIIHSLSHTLLIAMNAVGNAVGPEIGFLYVVVALENLTGGMTTAAFFVYLSRLCAPHMAATQFALMTSLWSLATPLASLSGWLQDHVGWTPFFLIAIAASLPGLILIRWLPKYRLG